MAQVAQSRGMLQPERLIFIFGTPRSGTTWLAKIFDSHPDVLYRHEPDATIRDFSFPLQCEPESFATHSEAARAYVHRLLDVRVLKSAASWPVFPKSYYGALKSRLRTAIVATMRAAGRAPLISKRSQTLPIPDLFDPARYPALRPVIKSVSSLGRAGLFAKALPGSRFVVIVRHPCGYIASTLRGEARGKFSRRYPAHQTLGTALSAHYGLTEERFNALSRPEQLAWNWVINYERAISDLNGVGAKVKLIRYEDLGSHPLEEAKALFAFAGLPWDAQTEAFIAKSTSSHGNESYYGVFKDTDQVVNRWRSELTPEDQRAIMAVVRQTTLAKLFPEDDKAPSVVEAAVA